MNNHFDPIVKAMEEFLNNPEQQTTERAMEISSNPLYKEFRRSLSAAEYTRHPVLPRFVEKWNEVVKPKLINHIRELAQKPGEDR